MYENKSKMYLNNNRKKTKHQKLRYLGTNLHI